MSALRDRLRQLEGQSGSSSGRPGPAQDSPAKTFANKLARLRVDAPPATRSRAGNARDLAARLEGVRLSPDGVLVRSTSIATGTRHGDATIEGGTAAVKLLDPGSPKVGTGSAVAMLDCETTGLSGGTGTVAFMVGVARFEPSVVTLTQLLMPTFGSETAMLARLSETLGGVGVVITYNGRSFDQPLLQTRYRLCRLEDPFASRRNLDLLGLTRRFFSRRWPNCRLQTAERRLLGFARRDDLPGSEAPQAWLDWLRQGRIDELERVFEHNRLDLISLAALLPALAHTVVALDHPDMDPRAAARYLAEQRGPEVALRHLKALRHALEPVDLSEMGRLAKSIGDWPLACNAWEELASRGCPKALLELAMYHEHRRRDPGTALELTERLLRLEGGLAALRHRKARLERKLAHGPGVAGKRKNLR
ncbi:MAG: ribonuclease H-like domain-containing protein [Gammaproteobacteria bacterium]|nr:ribonuclease H-like domain-containing protein [Gammaproteobacteria bacterium]